ncbi:MAG: diadenylate cyclase CdaA [Streptococcaceae bacterium]|nr:diadenylate cyclase CdaA [Streptococcaceae bacterium]
MNILDIMIIWFLVYQLLKAIMGTKEIRLIKGVMIFFIARLVSGFAQLTTVTYLMDQIITYWAIVVIIIFQPELRRFLEMLGRTTTIYSLNADPKDKIIQDYEKAINYMAKRKIGALIAIEQKDSLQEYIETGILLDAKLTSELLINIFIPNTPLHDGAVIIKNNKIAAASTYLPLSETTSISKDYGTRHRAAIGLSEVTDAITIIVSEETGNISITKDNKFLAKLTLEQMLKILSEALLKDENEESNQGFFSTFFDKKQKKRRKRNEK